MTTTKASMWSGLGRAVRCTLVMLVLCGLLYPLLMTGLGGLFFPRQAKGSLITADGVTLGSALVGQEFTDPRFLQGRPSQVQYNTYYEQGGERYFSDGSVYGGLASGSANYGPSNPALVARVQADLDAFLAAHPTLTAADVPGDLLTASGSGLDPHISPASAAVQLPALMEHTGLSEARLREIIAANTRGKLLGVFGEETVHVLGVNLDIARALGMIGAVQK